MNIAFYILLAIIVVVLWASLSQEFSSIGAWFLNILGDVKEDIAENENDKENEK